MRISDWSSDVCSSDLALQTPATWPINFAVLQARGVQGVVVPRIEVREAMRLAFEKLHLVVEPGGAAALAAVLAGEVAVTDATPVTLSARNSVVLVQTLALVIDPFGRRLI